MTPIIDVPVPPQAPPPRRKRWTREECARLSTLFDLERYELIEGELIEKMGKNHPHVFGLMLLVEWLRTIFPPRNVAQQISIDLRPEDNPTSEPEPDAVVLRCSLGELTPRPRPADILLVVEVSDTTHAVDLGAKRDLYARAGLPEYWVLDLPGRRIVAHREPVEGVYRSVAVYGEREPLAPLAAPSAAFSLALATSVEGRSE